MMSRNTPEALQAPESLAKSRDYTVGNAVEYIARAINAAPVQPRMTYEDYLHAYRGPGQAELSVDDARNVIDMTARRAADYGPVTPADINRQAGDIYVQEAA